MLQAIYDQATRAAEKASDAAEKSAACEVAVQGLQARMDRTCPRHTERIDELDDRLRETEIDVQDLKTTKDMAAKTGGKAGRKWGAIIAAGVVAIVKAAQAVLGG